MRIQAVSVFNDDQQPARVVHGPEEPPAVPSLGGALVQDGIPFRRLGTDDVQADSDRLLAAGMRPAVPPTETGPVVIAVLDDTVENSLQPTQRVV